MDRFPLRPSLFPNVPPYIRFLLPDQQYDPPLPMVGTPIYLINKNINTIFQEMKEQLTWNAPGGVSPVLSNCVVQAGFHVVDVSL